MRYTVPSTDDKYAQTVLTKLFDYCSSNPNSQVDIIHISRGNVYFKTPHPEAGKSVHKGVYNSNIAKNIHDQDVVFCMANFKSDGSFKTSDMGIHFKGTADYIDFKDGENVHEYENVEVKFDLNQVRFFQIDS